ncbi:MAG: amidohydrolase family protein, partial [Thermobispora bispora]|nr:amidohydrolase family protein [Thermobispora bispora]
MRDHGGDRRGPAAEAVDRGSTPAGSAADRGIAAAVSAADRGNTAAEGPYDLVVRSRRTVTPEGERPLAVAVRDGVIAALLPYEAAVPAGESADLGDLPLLPGLVDSHVHVNEPGRTHWEGFATATRAAAAGGVTTIVDMPLNSLPPTV